MGIKTVHIIIIFLSICITGYYSYFEFTSPSSPGSVSNLLGSGSALLTFALIFYVVSIFKKFRTI